MIGRRAAHWVTILGMVGCLVASFLVYRDHRALSAPVVLRLASHDALNNMYERTSRELQPRYRALWRSYRDDLDRLQVPPATLNAPWPGRSEGVDVAFPYAANTAALMGKGL